MSENKQPVWMEWVRREIGTRERPGTGSTPRILEYRRLAHTPIRGDDSAVPWCAIFVNAALEASGVRGTRSAAARSFTHSPLFVKLRHPHPGCVSVFSSSRGPASGHVGFYKSESPSRIVVVSGNSGDAVRTAGYPRSRLIGHYWPKSVPAPRGDGTVLGGATGGVVPSDA